VKASVFLDSGFTGIKGLSVITKKAVESEQVNGITIKYGPMVDRGLMRCVHCGKTSVKDYNKCPYCGSSTMDLNP
jgi:ribosomal protein L37AE/L43A